MRWTRLLPGRCQQHPTARQQGWRQRPAARDEARPAAITAVGGQAEWCSSRSGGRCIKEAHGAMTLAGEFLRAGSCKHAYM